jgi:IS30 family transposase
MKNKKHLTREQRYEIEALLRAGKRQKEIAELIGKNKPKMSISALIHKTRVDFRRINARYFTYYEQVTSEVF